MGVMSMFGGLRVYRGFLRLDVVSFDWLSLTLDFADFSMDFLWIIVDLLWLCYGISVKISLTFHSCLLRFLSSICRIL